jgi:SNF2 family DNA or RNA helicase
MCKAPVGTHDVYVVQGSIEDVDDEDDKFGDEYDVVNQSFGGVDVSFLREDNNKFDNLLLILNRLMDQGGKKVLVFCAYDNTFSTIAGMLINSGIRYGVLKGNSRVINKALHDYTEGNFNILLVNPTNYGSGMNLEITTDVVMFHKFESESEKQVIGRAHRYGRNSSLNVWYLLHQNELNINTT